MNRIKMESSDRVSFEETIKGSERNPSNKIKALTISLRYYKEAWLPFVLQIPEKQTSKTLEQIIKDNFYLSIFLIPFVNVAASSMYM